MTQKKYRNLYLNMISKKIFDFIDILKKYDKKDILIKYEIQEIIINDIKELKELINI